MRKNFQCAFNFPQSSQNKNDKIQFEVQQFTSDKDQFTNDLKQWKGNNFLKGQEKRVSQFMQMEEAQNITETIFQQFLESNIIKDFSTERLYVNEKEISNVEQDWVTEKFKEPTDFEVFMINNNQNFNYQNINNLNIDTRKINEWRCQISCTKPKSNFLPTSFNFKSIQKRENIGSRLHSSNHSTTT